MNYLKIRITCTYLVDSHCERRDLKKKMDHSLKKKNMNMINHNNDPVHSHGKTTLDFYKNQFY